MYDMAYIPCRVQASERRVHQHVHAIPKRVHIPPHHMHPSSSSHIIVSFNIRRFQTRSHTLRPARPTESKYNAPDLAILILSVCDARAAHA